MQELKELDREALLQKEKAFKKELFDLNFQRQHGRVEKPGRFKTIKRDIARILTLLNERERNGSSESSESKGKQP